MRSVLRREQFTLLVLMSLLFSAGSLYAVKPDTGAQIQAQKANPYKDGFKKMRKARLKDFSEEALLNQKIKLKGDKPKALIRTFNKKFKAQKLKLRHVRTQTDKRGNQHIRLLQYYKRIPIIGSDMIVHVNSQSEVYAVTGNMAPALDVNTIANLPEKEAIKKARKALRVSYKGQLKGKPRLVIFDEKLAFEIMLEDQGGDKPALWNTMVDAQNGEILFSENRIIHAAPGASGSHVTCTGNGLVDEGDTSYSIEAWRDSGANHFLYHKTELWGVYDVDAYDWEQQADSDWATNDRSAVSLANNLAITQKFVSDSLGWNSFNNAGAFATGYVHEGTDYVNAYWNGTAFYFGDGDGVTSGPLTTLDITAHEYGHAITDYSSNLIYSYESGALNESYSDILGALVEFYGQTDGRGSYPLGEDGKADWLMGEDAWLSDEALRDLKDPQRFGQPSYYQGTLWYTGSGDNGGVHYNSGVQNFAFYLLAEGGTGSNDGHAYSITGLGIYAAGEIAMYANMYLLTSSSQYQDSREAWILAATTLGYDATVVGDVWTACGVFDQVNNLTVSPTVLDFGNVGAGATATASISFFNDGAIATTISDISFTDSNFSVNATLPISVAGGATVEMEVLYTPSEIGSDSGTAVITSNAEDNPVLNVSVSGQGTAPAGISVTPGAIAATLLTGEQGQQNLVITNTGTADLNWAIEGVQTAELAAAYSAKISSNLEQSLKVSSEQQNSNKFVSPLPSLTRIAPAPQSGNNVLILRDNLPWGYNINEPILDSMGATVSVAGSAEMDTMDFSPYDLILIPGQQSTYFYTAMQTNKARFEAFLQNGGNMQIHVSPYYSSRVPGLQLPGGAAVTTTQYNEYDNNLVDMSHPIVDGAADSVVSGSRANHEAFDNLPTGTNVIATTTAGQATLIEYTVGAGVVIATGMTWEFGYNAGWTNAIPLLKNALAYSMAVSAGPTWLNISKASGVVSAGASDTVTVSLNATGLTGGVYQDTLDITHNDPATSNPLGVPVTLTVDGTRALDLAQDTIDFGVLVYGAADTVLLGLQNSGDEATTVSSIVSSDSVFSVLDAMPITVPAFGTVEVQVVFSPTAIANYSGTLTVTSDAESDPVQSAALFGVGEEGPQISVIPDSIADTLAAGLSAVHPLVISNTGGDTLNYNLSGSVGGAIYINEFCSNPDFIELRNLGGELDISGYVLSWVDNTSSSGSFTFPAGTVIKEGGRVVLREYSGTNNDSTFYWGSNIGWITSSIVSVSLFDADGGGLDFVRTTSSTQLPPTGVAWNGYVDFSSESAYRSVDEDSDDAADWANSGIPSEFALNPGQSVDAVGVGWMSYSSKDGSLGAGETDTVLVTLNTAGLLAGLQQTEITVNHNIEGVNAVLVPVSLMVEGNSALVVSENSVEFDTLGLGTSDTVVLTISNTGNENAVISALQLSVAGFEVLDTVPMTLAAFSEMDLTLVFNPDSVGLYSDVLTIISDADVNDTLSVSLSGVAKTGPIATITPDAHVFNMLMTDAPEDRTSVLENIGDMDLNYKITGVADVTGIQGIKVGVSTSSLARVELAKIYDENNFNYPHVPGQLIVTYKTGQQGLATVSLSSFGDVKTEELAIARRPGASVKAHSAKLVQLLTLGASDDAALKQALSALKADPAVDYVELNYVRKLNAIPNDASFSSLYGLHNTGQTGGTVDADIDAVEAWDSHTGSQNMVLGVIDTGIDYLHPDLAENIWTNPGEIAGNGVDDDGNGYIDDMHGYDFYNNDADPMDGHSHGTHVAGTIAGRGDNGIGVAGVNWKASLVAIKIFSDGGSTTDAAILNAIAYANAMGIQATNNSWGGGAFSQALKDVIEAGNAEGYLFIAAAGNDYGNNNDVSAHYPSTYDCENIVAVASTDDDDLMSSFSNYGPTTVDLGAPGSNTYSTIPSNSYGSKSGTSMATPHVTGAAGLIWSYNPSLSGADVKRILMESVDVVPSMNGTVLSNGRLNIATAIANAGSPWLTASPMDAGVLTAGQSQNITVTVDPSTLTAGTHNGQVLIATNDPANPELVIDITANIAGCKGLVVTPSSYDFGEEWVGLADTTTLTLENPCNDTTFISEVNLDNSVFSVLDSAPIAVPAFGSIELDVVFAPDSALAETGNLILTSDADSDSVQTILLTGAGRLSPELDLTPDSIEMTLETGLAADAYVVVANSGADTLAYNIEVDSTVGWMTLASTSGILLAGESDSIQVTLSSVGLEPADYTTLLTVQHNVPGDTDRVIPVTLHVISCQGAANIALSATSFEEFLNTDETSTQTLTLTNDGDCPTEVSMGIQDAASLQVSGVTLDAMKAQAKATGEGTTQIGNGSSGSIESTPALLSLDNFQSAVGTTHILVWNAYSDNNASGETQNTLNAIAAHYSDFTSTLTAVENPDSLETLLADKHVFLIPEQENLSIDLTPLGVSWKAVLERFLDRGGKVIMCGAFHDRASGILTGSELLDYSYIGSASNPISVHDAEHPMADSLAANITPHSATLTYSVNNTDIDTILTDASGIVSAVRDVRNGKVILIGFDYFSYDTNISRLIANAVQLETYGGWLTLDQYALTVPAGDTVEVTLNFDATDLTNGVYNKDIILEHTATNDSTPLNIPVQLTVGGVVNTYSVIASATAGGTITPADTSVVTEGDSLTYTITADSNYRLVDVLVDSVSVGAVTSYTFLNITSDHTIEAIFEAIPAYEVIASATVGGSITPAGTSVVTEGDSLSYTITADSNYRLVDVLVDSVSVGAVTSYTFLNITSDHTIEAIFEAIPAYEVVASATVGGSITPAGTSVVTEGDSLSYTITADSNYRLVDVLVDSVSVGAVTSYTFLNITSDHTIEAIFEAIPAYEVIASATVGGSITPAGTSVVTEGDSLSYTITADSNYRLVDVLVDSVSVGAVTSYTFLNITSDHTIEAIFEAIPAYEVVASATEGGTITPADTSLVTEGDSLTFTIIADSGYIIEDVIVDGVKMGAISSYTFSDVQADHTIEAVFKAIPQYVVIASATTGGTITPADSSIVWEGESLNYAIAADSGYQIVDVLVDGISVGAVTSYEFTNISANHTIEASFELIPIPVYEIAAAAGANGTISPEGVINVDEGQSVSFTITPDSGFQVADILVDSVSVGALDSYEFTNVTANHTIDALFEEIPTQVCYEDLVPLASEWIFRNPWSDQTQGTQIVNADGALDLVQRAWGYTSGWMINTGRKYTLEAGTEYTIRFAFKEDATYGVNQMNVGFANGYQWDQPKLVQSKVSVPTGFSSESYSTREITFVAEKSGDFMLSFELYWDDRRPVEIHNYFKDIEVCPGETNFALAKFDRSVEPEEVQIELTSGSLELSALRLNSQLHIEIHNQGNSVAALVIVDGRGNQIFQSGQMQLAEGTRLVVADLSHASPGMYWVQVVGDKNRHSIPVRW